MEMMKRWLAMMGMAVCTQLGMAQTDTLLMKVGEIGVSRAEFEYAYHKNKTQMPLNDFLQHYIEVKWKVNQACAQGLDTTRMFRGEMAHYKASLVPRQEVVESDTAAYSQPRDGEWIAHLCVRVSQRASSSELRRVQAELDSLYTDSLSAMDLDEWIARNEGRLPSGWKAEVVCVTPMQLTDDVWKQVHPLKVGQVSHPFVSAAGVHMVQRLDSVEVQEQVSLPPQVLLSDTCPLLQEYHDGLLLNLLDSSESKPTPQDLESYFRKHKKHYAWKLPHFKGIVLQSSSEEKLEQLVRYLKGFRQEEWMQALQHFCQTAGTGWLKIEEGLWQIGRNAVVDRFFFKQGDYKPSDTYPYVKVLGKKLKKHPEVYTDVLSKVEADYRKFRQQKETLVWKKKFKVEINQEVLKTVKIQDSI